MKTLQVLQTLKSCLAASLLLFILLGCDSDKDESAEGFVKLYNLSIDSPSIHLIVDEDLNENNDDDDHYENTFTSVAYGAAHTNISLPSQSYEYQLAWQDSDSSATEDLAVIYADELTITEETLTMIVLTDSILSPQILVHSIPLIDDEDDETNDLFNLQILNMHSNQQSINFYIAKENESFNEAVLIGQFNFQELSENQKFDQDNYTFYITEAGSEDVLFQSNSIDFSYSSQYVMAIRDNHGAGSSPYVLDKISSTSVTEYVDANSEAQFSAYNGVASQEQLTDYQEVFSLHINGVTDTPAISNLAFGELSLPQTLTSGDYSVDITTPDGNSPLLSNHLLSLIENTNKTIFFYAEEQYVDLDNDGNIDENGDGVIDEIEVNLHTLIVENSLLTSSYQHEIEIVNLIQSDEFSQVEVFFVRQDETISSADYKREISYKNNSAILLKNNSYQVFIIAEENGSSIILNTFELTLDEYSKEQYLVLENSELSPTGYKTTLFNQVSEQTLE